MAANLPARAAPLALTTMKANFLAAEKMGFSAYAVTRTEDDPLAKAIHGLLDHAVEATHAASSSSDNLRACCKM